MAHVLAFVRCPLPSPRKKGCLGFAEAAPMSRRAEPAQLQAAPMVPARAEHWISENMLCTFWALSDNGSSTQYCVSPGS